MTPCSPSIEFPERGDVAMDSGAQPVGGVPLPTPSGDEHAQDFLKRALKHLGFGVLVAVSGALACFIFAAVVSWLEGKGIVGASWLKFAVWELAAGCAITLVIWVICLFALPFSWSGRFRNVLMVFFKGTLGWIPGCIGVMVAGFISAWLYTKGIVALGAIIRLIEVGCAIALIGGLIFWLCKIVATIFIRPDTES